MPPLNDDKPKEFSVSVMTTLQMPLPSDDKLKESGEGVATTLQMPPDGGKALDSDDVTPRLPVKPTWILYSSVLLGFILSTQYGWSTSQLNLRKFNNEKDCNARPVAPGTCIMFSGHSKSEWTVVVNAWIVGGMVGALSIGRFADRFGRKRVLTYTCAFIVSGAIIQAAVSNIWAFAFGRLLAGIASGAVTGSLGTYINEVSPPHLRSRLGVVLHSGIAVGIVLVATTHFYMDFHSGWRYIAAFPIVLAAIFLALSPFIMVESPVWLLLHGRREEAEEVLTRLFGKENVPAAIEWIKPKRKVDLETEAPADPCWSEVGHDGVRDGKGVSFADLIAPPLRRQFIIAVGLACMQKITGINSIFYYSSNLLSGAGMKDARISALVIDIVNMVPTLVSGLFSNRFGNRPMLLASVFGMLVSAIGITLSLTYDWSALTVVFAATYVATFGVSLGPIMFVIIADIVPDHARATVSSVGVFVAWASNLIVGVGYPYVWTSLENLAYIPFIVLLTISFIFLLVLLPETSGKTTDEIQETFRVLREGKTKDDK